MVLQLDDDIFPENLKLLRKRRGFSQIALARKTGISVYLLRGIERGIFYSRILKADYDQLCDALHADPEVLGYVPLFGAMSSI